MNSELKGQLRQITAMVNAKASDEDYANALKRIDELLARHPEEHWLWKERAHVHSMRDDDQAALDDLSKAIALCDLEPDFFYTRGIILFQQRRYQEAVSDFTKVIELCDYHRSDYYREGAHFFRADSFLRLGEFAKAKDDCKHVRAEMRTWTDRIRSKNDILAECEGKFFSSR